VSHRWVLRGGLAYDQTPTRNFSRDPRIPDAARRWVSLGAGYAPSAKLEFDIAYSHLFVGDGGIDDVSATGDRLVGHFKNSGDLFGISMQYKF
jgi:long-chain fatty acid transport protein